MRSITTGKLRSGVSSLRHTYRYNGLRALLWKGVEWVAAPIGQIGLESICHKDVSEPIDEVTARVDIEISIATEDDIDQLVELVESNWGHNDEYGPYTELGYRGTIVDRMERGSTCFVARHGCEILHYNWISFDWEEAIVGTGLVADLAGGRDVVTHDGFTVEAWRGKGIHTAVNNRMLRWLHDAGYQNAYTVVGTLDRSSNITHHRLSWRFSGVLLYLLPRRSGRPRVWRLKGTLAPFERTA